MFTHCRTSEKLEKMKDKTPFRLSTEQKKTRTHTHAYSSSSSYKREEKKNLGKNVSVLLNAMENHAIAQIFREYKIQQQRLYMTVATTSNCFVIFMH